MTRTVLLVDGDQNVLYELARMLQTHAYQAYTAASVAAAIEMLDTHELDVLVTEERFPGASGVDLLANAARHHPEVMRIMLTGHVSTDVIIRAINEGRVYHFLTKPCNDFQLSSAIHNAIDYKDLLLGYKALLLASQKQIEQIDRCKKDLETLAGLIAKNLQRPVEAFSRSCRLLMERYPELFGPSVNTTILDVFEAVEDIQQLIHDLLTQARPLPLESGPHLCLRGLRRSPSETAEANVHRENG
jgi:FixJ family two-component response regulator